MTDAKPCGCNQYKSCGRDHASEQSATGGENSADLLTVIPVMYRDAANYKDHGEYLIEGELTPEQVEELRSTLEGGDTFVPEQIGLSHLGPNSHDYDEMDDHAYHEMDLDDIEVVENTGPSARWDGAERVGTPEEFVARMKSASESGWDPSESEWA